VRGVLVLSLIFLKWLNGRLAHMLPDVLSPISAGPDPDEFSQRLNLPKPSGLAKTLSMVPEAQQMIISIWDDALQV
jgi:hypothetical protein